MTLGNILFFGGIILFAVALVSMIIINIVLSVKSRKLKKLLNEKYGE